MTEFLLWMLACVGMTNIIVESDIFRKLKDFLEPYVPAWMIKLSNCYQCMGFWSGVFVTICLLFMNNSLVERWFYIFMGGCASSFLSVFFAMLISYLEANSVINNE